MSVAAITAITAAIGTAMNVASTIQQSKQGSILQKESPGERAMLTLQQQKAADLAGMGGLSSGQYQRAQMPEDILAQQTQTMVNTMSANPLMSAYRKEAFAKMALAKTKQGILENQIRIEDVDEQRAAKNAFAAQEAAARARAGEAVITARENERRRQELAQKQAMWSSFGKMAASTGKLIGATVDSFENKDMGYDDITVGGGYNPSGGYDIGFGLEAQLAQPDMAGIQQMPTSELQGGLPDDFKMTTGIPSLMDGIKDNQLPTLSADLVNPYGGIATSQTALGMLQNQYALLDATDPTNYF